MATDHGDTILRQDVLATESPDQSEGVMKARAAGVPLADGTSLRRRQAQGDPHFAVRKALVEPASAALKTLYG